MLQKARRHTGRRIRRVHSAPTDYQCKVSGSFHFPTGILFIGRSRYLFAIGHQRVLSLRRGASWIHAGFHVADATRGHIYPQACFSHTGLSPSVAGLSSPVPISLYLRMYRWPHYPVGVIDPHGLGIIPVRSPLLRESLLLYFPGVTKMFHFTPLASEPYDPQKRAFRNGWPRFRETGFPIRTSRDLRLFGGYSGLIAAFHVLHRLLVPRHPPCTFGSLTLESSSLGDRVS